MKHISLLLPDSRQPKWAMPDHFLNIFKWNGLGDRIKEFYEVSFDLPGRPAYVLNLNNQYRLDRDLAHTKAPGNHCVYDAFDTKLWHDVEKHDGMLVLDSAVESMSARDAIAEGLLLGIEKERIHPGRVAVLQNNLRASPLFEDRYFGTLKSRPKIIGFDACFWLLAGFNRETPETSELLHKRAMAAANKRLSRPYKYVSFNGRLRPHRFYVVLWLFANGFFDFGQVSFLAYQSKIKRSEEEKLRATIAGLEYPDHEHTLKAFHDLIRRLPISIDVSLEESLAGAAYKRTLPWRSQASEIYDDAWFSIIVDTEFHNRETLFLTPIAFKSFMNFSPFVYFGNHGALERMRALGFKTFSPLIDESYDTLINPHARMTAAFSEIQRLCSMSPPELQEFYNELWPALEHNYWNIHRDAPAIAEHAIDRDLLGPMGLNGGTC